MNVNDFDKYISTYLEGELRESDKEAFEKLLKDNSKCREKLKSYQSMLDELSNLEVSGSQIVVLEAAVLLEAGWQDMADQVWVVVVSEDLAIARLKERNGLDEDAARARIASQLTNSERIEAADVIVENNNSLEELNNLLEKLWVDLLERVTHRFTKE